MAGQIETLTRSADIACRFGSEELVLVLPDIDLEVARQRVENLRQRIERLNLSHVGRSLGSLTISQG